MTTLWRVKGHQRINLSLSCDWQGRKDNISGFRTERINSIAMLIYALFLFTLIREELMDIIRIRNKQERRSSDGTENTTL